MIDPLVYAEALTEEVEGNKKTRGQEKDCVDPADTRENGMAVPCCPQKGGFEAECDEKELARKAGPVHQGQTGGESR